MSVWLVVTLLIVGHPMAKLLDIELSSVEECLDEAKTILNYEVLDPLSDAEHELFATCSVKHDKEDPA